MTTVIESSIADCRICRWYFLDHANLGHSESEELHSLLQRSELLSDTDYYYIRTKSKVNSVPDIARTDDSSVKLCLTNDVHELNNGICGVNIDDKPKFIHNLIETTEKRRFDLSYSEQPIYNADQSDNQKQNNTDLLDRVTNDNRLEADSSQSRDIQNKSDNVCTVSVDIDDNKSDQLNFDSSSNKYLTQNGTSSTLNVEDRETENTSLNSTSAELLPAAPKSWASLLRNTSTARQAIVLSSHEANLRYNSTNTSSLKNRNRSMLNAQDDINVERCLRSIVFRMRRPLNHHGISRNLRGMVNSGNWCYVNATLQALAACPPFFNFLNDIAYNIDIMNSYDERTPVLSAMAWVMKKLGEAGTVRQKQSQMNNNALEPLNPAPVYEMLSNIKPAIGIRGKQEDAEEFLLCVLNGMHEEMVACEQSLSTKYNDNKAISDDNSSIAGEDSSWMEVGASKKPAFSRKTEMNHSVVKHLFGGSLRYIMHVKNEPESHVTQPFFTLPLDIDSPNCMDIQDAMRSLCRSETMAGGAERRAVFERLPVVLIIQLKYFMYTADGSTRGGDCMKKLDKVIKFPVEFYIENELLSSLLKKEVMNKPNQWGSYKLFAVVFHHGERAEGGHYTAAVFYGGSWAQLDDDTCYFTNHGILNPQPQRSPYLLFYRRLTD